MQSICLSSPHTFSFGAKAFHSAVAKWQHGKPFFHASRSSLHNKLHFDPLRFSPVQERLMAKKGRRSGVVCYSAVFTPRNLQWISAVSTAILMLVKGTAINKSYLVPLFALQAPASVVSWIQGEYGAWSAFLALLVRLFFFIPGELELPLMALLLVIVAPLQATSLRGTQTGTIISLAIAGYVAFLHFSRAGSLQRAFDQGSIIATLAVIVITAVPLLLLV
ncbi:hypothetical protein Nepgr_028681 [Nepenthes gracilis]|uniref:Uncharacterized protein n=1 Tax=Nepenthes gracilis TaxID=150966 RepID=A0AAD3TB76_NEPGR|nr:hypothetical protein Nepgr_028681 [Nepenthes gracilis]